MNTQEISLDLSKRPNAVELVMLGQGDRSGTTIRATIYDNGTLLDSAGLSANLVMRLPDKRHYYRKNATLSNGVAEVVIDETLAASVAGQTDEAYFQILQGDEVIASSSRFCVRILRSALEGTIKPESYDDKVNDAVAATINANNAAAAANAAMERAEQFAEDVGEAESLRVTAEQGRVSAESSRVSAESSRASAESGRASAERGRVSAESGRVSAEQGRVSAEQGRVTAENARQTASATAVDNANAAAANANGVASDLLAAKERGDFDAEIADATIRVGQTIGTPSANVTLGGTPGHQTFNFALDGVKGEKGDTGDSHTFRITKSGQSIVLTGTDASTSTVTLTNADIIALLGYVPQPSVASVLAWRIWDDLDVDITTWASLQD